LLSTGTAAPVLEVVVVVVVVVVLVPAAGREGKQ
jgi:hypothetical protein